MKKTLLLLVALITATIAFAKTEIDGIYYNLNDETKTAEVTYQYQYREDNYSGVTSITIPEKVTYNSTEYSVTSIGDYAFCYCSSLTSITIPNGVTSIGDVAFAYCSSLTSITIPNGVTSIGYGAFFYCDNLTSITIPNSVTSIGDDAFSGCSSLTSIDVEANNQNYASIDGVLYNKEITTLICCPGGKTSITIPNSVTSIGNDAFYNCSSLTSITIPNSVTSIGGSAFENCSSLTSISIPNSVTSIASFTFDGCSSLTSISIPNSVTSIGFYAFRSTAWLNNQPDGCIYINSLLYIYKGEMPENTHIDVNEGTTMICSNAFRNCSRLTSITIPNSVTSIGDDAFRYCSSLTSITIPNSVTSIASFTFDGCSSLTSITIPNSVTSIENGAFSGCSSLTSITIPNSVTSIGERAFFQCTSLTSITIPNGVISIGNDAFEGCHNLTSITIEATTPPTLGTSAFERTKLAAIYIPDNTLSAYKEAWGTDYNFVNNENTLTIHVETPGTLADKIFDAGQSPAFVPKLTVIGTLNDDDFTCMRETMTSLVDIDLSGITNTSGVYFSDKDNLLKILLPENLTSIGSSAFSSCDALTSITIPNSVTSIGSGAFGSCSSLTSITIPNSVTSIGNYAFNYCSSLTSITIPNSVTSIGNDAFYNCDALTSITIGNSVTSIGNSAFEFCSSLTSITIPNSVTSIGDRAFRYCFSLTSIEVDANNPNYASIEGVLYNKDVTTLICCPGGKTSITIPNSVTSIASFAFDGCFSLTSIEVDANNPNYASIEGVLYNKDITTLICCPSAKTSITIPNSVTSIASFGFYGCSSLTSITIPNSVTSIASFIFYGCSSLTSISIPNSVTSIGDYAFCYCSSLTSITIPNGVTSIGEGAFDGCESLTSISIPNSVTSIGYAAFSNCSSLTSISIPNSVTSIGNYAFHGCSSLTSITCLGSTPPEASDLSAYTSTCTLIVPKEAYSSYLRHEYWGQFLTIRTIGDKEIKTEVNNSAWGAVEGDGYYDNGDEATLTATANSGYRFVKWSDEVTDNPRTVVVTQDSTFTAIFEANSFAITTAVNDDAMGSVTEGGEYTYGTEITLTATPNDGYRFAQWSDGNTDNPRIVTVTENKTYTAEFEVAEATNVETSKISSANIYTTNGTLHIEGATNDYHILDAAGRLIYTGNATTLTLPRGIYLVTIDGEVEKIVL